MASITSWTRIEPVSRDPQMTDGLKAAIHDPLWLLARQWQFGEFQATDAGSPALARFTAAQGRLDRFLPDYDPDRLPTRFTKYGLTDFDLEYWTGSAWALIPGGEVRGNDKVHVRARFSPIRTDRVRVVVKGAMEQFSRVIELEAMQASPQTSDRDMLWVADAAPAGAVARGDGWQWADDPTAPAGGARTHFTPNAEGVKQHYFEDSSEPLVVHEAESLFAYVRLDPKTPPKQIMLQWFDGVWEHRAYWGESLIEWGAEGQASRRWMGDLPKPGVWTRLEVPARLVGLEGRTIKGAAFTQVGGLAVWGAAGKTRPLEPGVGLFAEYFPSLDLTGQAVTRIDPVVDFAWGDSSPHPSIPTDKFSARWTGQITPRFSETYTFHLTGDDGVRLWVDGKLIIGAWMDQAATEYAGTVALQAGRKHSIQLEYYDSVSVATCKLMWSSPRQAKQIVPQSQLYPPAAYTVPSTNAALSANGGRAYASSTHSAPFAASGVNNGDRTGAAWGLAGGGWNDATLGSFPDWVQVSFNGEKLIEEIGVVTLQDAAPVEPIPYWLGGEQALDPRAPLEALVEREQAITQDDLRAAAEGGLHFLRILASKGLDKYGAAARRAWPLQGEGDLRDPASRRFAGVMGGRAPDGRKLRAALKASAPALPAELAVTSADQKAMRAAADAWLRWCVDLAETSADAPRAWRRERMEYAFAVSADTPAGRVDLAAAEYPGGALDWHAFDARLKPEHQEANLVVEAIPAPISYRGMPAPRYWQMEDGEVNFGGVKAGETDLAKLALLEFALVGGDDWFVIPVELEAGAVCAPRTLEVDDTFGVRTAIRHHGEVDGEHADWSLFGLSRTQTPQPADASPLFFLAPSLLTPMEGAPLEEVLFLRDEMANMAWAVERIVQGQAGRPLDRYEAYRTAQTESGARQKPLEAHDAATLVYKVGSEPPDYWIPMLPAQVGPRAYRLRRGAWPAADGAAIGPLGRALEPERRLDVHEEEIPRSGARVTRSWQFARGVDGRPYLWVGRRKQPGRGEGSSGLRFDIAQQSATQD